MRKLTSVYLGGPIDLANTELFDERNWIRKSLANMGFTVFDPSQSFTFGGTNAKFIKDVNDSAISHADIVLLVFNEKIQSVGTAMELQTANAMNKQVLVVAPWHFTPLYIRIMATAIFPNIKEALSEVEKMKKKVVF